jgi:hypothetical protein
LVAAFLLERAFIGSYRTEVTIGFAATFLENGQAAFLVAADSRYSAAGETADMALKTYSLGRRAGAVAAGSALSVSAAAEVTRAIADDHEKLSPNLPISFYSTTRLFSFFLDRAEAANPWSQGSEVVIAGFLANGSPALAKVITRRNERTEVHCYAPKQRGFLVAMVGQSKAKEQIASAVSRAFVEARQHWIERAAATIWYLSKHEGMAAIGGAPSIAVCSRGKDLYWPFVVVDGRTYLRGFDVTEGCPNPTGENVFHIIYDENWHSDREERPSEPNVRLDQGFLWLSRFVDDWVRPNELFEWKVDHESLTPAPDLGAPPSVVVIVRRGEVPWVPSSDT